MNTTIYPYSDQGFEDFKAWSEEAEANLDAMRAELESRYQRQGDTLDQALKAHAPEGLLEAYERISADMERYNDELSAAAFYCYQLHSQSRVHLLAQIYTLALGRTSH
jgi:hypothetical protein